MILVADITVKGLVRPKLARAQLYFVAFMGSKTLPRVHDLTHGTFRFRSEECMHMIGHHTKHAERNADLRNAGVHSVRSWPIGHHEGSKSHNRCRESAGHICAIRRRLPWVGSL